MAKSSLSLRSFFLILIHIHKISGPVGRAKFLTILSASVLARVILRLPTFDDHVFICKFEQVLVFL